MTNSLLLGLALSEEQNLEVTADACKRVRYRQSECQSCADICPEQAISLDLGPTINSNCTQCGLCINACPTETFRSKIDLEQYWLDQIQEFEKQSTKNGHKKILTLHCHQAQPADERSLPVHCIGNINENLLLGSALTGLREIVIHTGNCSECALSKGVMLFNESFNHARALTQLVNIGDLVVQQVNQPKEKGAEVKLSRRAFFSRISKQVKERTVPADYAKVNPLRSLLNYQEDEANTRKHLSPRRQSLRKLLMTATKHINDQASNHTIEHWQKMQVEQEKCVACAICVNVCPTGALSKTVKDSHLYRYYSSALCTNCGLCQEACPQDIIHFTMNYTLPDIIDDKPELVARVELNECQICGETIPTIEGEICTTCQKRQLSPMFLHR